MYNKQLAKIRSLRLSFTDRRILMLNLDVDYEIGTSQNVLGGLVLDEPIKHDKDFYRQGTAFGCEIIRLFLEALKIDDMSEATGRYIYVFGEGEGLSFKPKGIETLRLDGDQKEIVIAEVIKRFK